MNIWDFHWILVNSILHYKGWNIAIANECEVCCPRVENHSFVPLRRYRKLDFQKRRYENIHYERFFSITLHVVLQHNWRFLRKKDHVEFKRDLFWVSMKIHFNVEFHSFSANLFLRGYIPLGTSKNRFVFVLFWKYFLYIRKWGN